MLDLTKPVRFVRSSDVILSIFPGPHLGQYLIAYEDEEGILHGTIAFSDEVENIPEPKVATAFITAYKNNEEDIFLHIMTTGGYPHSCKITYTEGAENPWAIEEIKP